jgi:catechol-2,3-dioxygenase
MKFIKIKETCLYLHDLETARHFYHEILELPVISYQPGKHIFFKVGSSVLLCFDPNDSKTKQSPPPHYAEGRQHFAFEVPADEYDNIKKMIGTKNIHITDSVIWPSGNESFYFEDPEKNVLEIVPDRGVWD